MSKKIISIIVALCFICDNAAFALSPWAVSDAPGDSVRAEMYALGQKRFAEKRGPGAIDFDNYLSGQFKGIVPEVPEAVFIPSDYSNLPESWSNNAILSKTDLVDAFKYFRDEEAGIGNKLSIEEGYFETDEPSGELPIARIERAKGGKITLVLHTKFVQMWNHIRQNDIWFEYTFPDGEKRTVSLAWAIFYRIAKHEMADLRKEDFIPKGGGHIGKDYSGILRGPIYGEDDANAIGGRYAAVNDSLWMWFLGSYCFGNATRYNNDILADRLDWFFNPDSSEAVDLNLRSEFANLKFSQEIIDSSIDLALAVNYRFFSRPNMVVPEAEVASGLIDDYLKRTASIRKTVYATGAESAPDSPVVPARKEAAKPAPEFSYRTQAAFIWFDAEMRLVVKIDPRALRSTGLKGRELEEVSGNLKDSIRKAYSLLELSEQQALFKFQKSNKIQRHTGEWMEIPLPVRVESEMAEMARVTPHEIILSSGVARAPPAVLALVLNHALRRSIDRFNPHAQPHDAAVFQKTLELISAKPELRTAWNNWKAPGKMGDFFGRQWDPPILHADEIIRIEEAWHGFLNDAGAAHSVYHQLIKARTGQSAIEIAASFFKGRDIPAPSVVYRETYRTGKGTRSTHFYIVYNMGSGVNKVIRIAPGIAKDWIATEDAAIGYELGSLRVDIVRDVQKVAGDIVEERTLYAKYPALLKLIDDVNIASSKKKGAAIERLKQWSLDNDPKRADRTRAASDILFGIAKTDPDFNTRIALNRFVFDRKTERPAEFPQTTFNYSAFDRDGFTVRIEVPYEDTPDEVRARWNQFGSAVQSSHTLSPVKIDRDKKTVEYKWEVPVDKGWVHYAFQTRRPGSDEWNYLESPLDVENPQNGRSRINGIIKFQEDIRGLRLVGLRPEVFNLNLDGSKPMVDEFGNIQLGTLNDLEKQLQEFKDQGFDEIYIQALEVGSADDKVNPDASPFAPLDQIHVSSRIGGMKGLFALKRAADKIGIAIALDMIPHAAKSDRQSSPRTPVWVLDGNSGRLVRRSASDGGLSPEWEDSYMRNWADPRNLKDYIDQLSTLARLGFDFRIDVAHVFDTTIQTRGELTGPAKIYGYITTNTMNTLDLRGTLEPNSVLGAILYEVKKAGLEKGHSVKFFGENWHGNEPRLIQAGVDYPFDPLVANLWNIVRKEKSAKQEFVDTSRWLRGIWERWGGGTVSAIYNHDDHVPAVDAFGDAAFVATAATIFANGGASFQHFHYSYRNPDGSVNWEKVFADHWRVYVNNYGPARIVNGNYFPGAEGVWGGKSGSTAHALWKNRYFADLGNFSKKIGELTVFDRRSDTTEGPSDFWPIPLDVGHDRVIGAARKVGQDTLIGLFHMGSQYAASINFYPHSSRQYGAGLGTFDDEAVYKLEEVYTNAKPSVTKENPGEQIFFSGKEINQLGIGPRRALPILGIRVYRLAKVSDDILKLDPDQYRMVLRDSIQRFRRYGPQDRIAHCIIAREIMRAVEGGMEDFSKLFEQLSRIVAENPRIEVSDLSSIFHDIIFYHPELKKKIHDYLINIAIFSRGNSPVESATAVKILRGAKHGDIVLSSPESLWSSGTGGLALYITDIAKQLAELGVNVTVVVPLFADKKSDIFKKFNPRDTGRTIKVPFDNGGNIEENTAKIYESRQSGVRVLYLECDERFAQLDGKRADGKSAYEGSVGYRLRFARMLSLGTLLAAREMNIHPSVIQTTDWPTAYIKAFLEGYGREDLNDKNLRNDPHFAGTRVISVGHNLHRDYLGKIDEPDLGKRDMLISLDLGFKPEEWEILVSKGDWSINPAYTASLTADEFVTVSPGYQERSLNWLYDDEFGKLVAHYQWKKSTGAYSAIPNGFGLAEWQRKLFGFSFMDIGHESERRRKFEELKKSVLPERKKALQKAFGLREDSPGFEAFLVDMLHRICPQKGHQLLLGEVWSSDNPDILKSFSGWFEGMNDVVSGLSPEDRNKLISYASANGRPTLRAVEVLCILIPEFQFIVAGKVGEPGLGGGLFDIAHKFPNQFKFRSEPVNSVKEEELYGLIYTGASVFGMPSEFEPKGLSYQEAHGGAEVMQVTNRDGPKDSVINLKWERGGEQLNVSEGFEPFNPVAWLTSLRQLHAVFRDDREIWQELQYRAVTQDNRWLIQVKNGYLPLYTKVSGEEDDFELRALEVASAIHRARIQNHADPANELMKEGFTPQEAVDQLSTTLRHSPNDILASYIINEQIPFLAKVDKVTRDLLVTTMNIAAGSPESEKHRDRSARALGVLSSPAVEHSVTSTEPAPDVAQLPENAPTPEPATVMPVSQELVDVISEFTVRLGLDIGPGTFTEEERIEWETVLKNIWQSADLLNSNGVEIIIPQQMKLTDSVKKALDDIRKRRGSDSIKCREYSDEEHLGALLKTPKLEGVKRIIISERTIADINIKGLAESDPDIFIGVRLVNVALPAGYDKMDAGERSIHQSKLLMLAIIARLYEGDNTSAPGVILRTMLKDMLDSDTDIDEFMANIVESRDESADPAKAKDRIIYCLGKIVSLIEKIGTEIRLMKEFWTAA